MTDTNLILDSRIDPDAPVTSDLFYHLRDNPISAFEGSDGATIAATGWHPYDMVNVGDGADGLIYDFAVDGAVAAVETPLFEDGYEYMLRFDGLSGSVDDFTVSVYKEVDASYHIAALMLANNLYAWTGFFSLLLPRVSNYAHSTSYEISTGSAASGGITTASIWDATLQPISKAKIAVSNFDAGKIFLHRRREYISG